MLDMQNDLYRLVSIGRERYLSPGLIEQNIFNGKINVKLSNEELQGWKHIKFNSPFFRKGIQATNIKINTNIVKVFYYQSSAFAKELCIESSGEFISSEENKILLKNRSRDTILLSNIEFEIWSLIHCRTNLYKVFSYFKYKYDVDTAYNVLFFLIPNLQSNELCDIFADSTFEYLEK